MSDGQTKQRFSARVKTETLEKIETYQEENNLDNRSNAIEVLVDEHHKSQQPGGVWETIAQQALYAVTFSLLVAVISGIGFAVGVVLASFPTPVTVIIFSLLVASALTATGSGLLRKYSTARARRIASEVER
jgi:Flp pilus assembly protein TadB